MWHNLEFVLGLLDRHDPAYAGAEDFESDNGLALRLCQRVGFLRTEPELNPVASCPHCREGVPWQLRGRYVCGTCHSTVDRRHLLLWRFDLEALLVWLARALELHGEVRQIDERLWQLGSVTLCGLPCECFIRRSGPLSPHGRQRLLSYRNAVLLQALPGGAPVEGFRGPCLSLLELLRQEQYSLGVTDLARLLWSRGNVRFDDGSGVLWVGDAWVGEVPFGSKEYHFLVCLAQNKDRFVTYGDIKHYVLQHAGSKDATEEATFCQKLKSRIRKWVPHIDVLIATTNKADGYRLRGHVEL
jgi:hypothetical protein